MKRICGGGGGYVGQGEGEGELGRVIALYIWKKEFIYKT